MTTMKSGRGIIRVRAEDVAKAIRDVDWALIDSMTDAEIARRVARDPDAPPICRDLRARVASGRARVVVPIARK